MPGHAETRVVRGASPLTVWTNGIYLVLAIVEVAVAIRFVLKLLAANPDAGFSRFVYGLTGPLLAPFNGLLGNPSASGGNLFEVTSLVAMAVYALAAWLLVKVVNLILNRTVTQSRQDFS